MDFRRAVMQDLPQLKAVYRDIIKDMNHHDIPIWDDIYPCEFFEDDIKNNRLYLLTNDRDIVSAFALCDSSEGEKAVNWENNDQKALYLDRLGVSVNYRGKGIGSLMLVKAREAAKVSGVQYLRLFVVDINEPAARLYARNGFMRVEGVYDEVFDDGFVLHEYGYEVKL